VGIIYKSRTEIEQMRLAGLLVARVLEELRGLVAPGVTTAELDAVAERRIREAGGVPSFKGYHGFPATICASVNEQVIHGIPSSRALVEGDILSIDLGAIVGGYHGDAAVTIPVEPISERAAELLRVTEEALYKGIEQARVGARVSDIGHAVQRHVEAHGFSVVREFVGHGIGLAMHEEPQIPNYGEPGRGQRLADGMVLAIEPMINVGKPAVKILSDGWTAVTRDGSLSAHFEHTVSVTTSGPVILTALNGDTPGPQPGASSATPASGSEARRGNRADRVRAGHDGDD
jgi:methionyl aminopeptidase